MSTAAFGLRPLPALSLTAAVMATTFGGCGCRPAPSASVTVTVTSQGAVVLGADVQRPASATAGESTPL